MMSDEMLAYQAKLEEYKAEIALCHSCLFSYLCPHYPLEQRVMENIVACEGYRVRFNASPEFVANVDEGP